MGKLQVVLFILGFFAVAVSAHTLPQALSAPEENTEVGVELSDEEKFQVGLILLEVAHDIEQDDELNSETDEYFFRKLWGKVKNATKKYGGKLKKKLKKYAKNAAAIVKEAAKEIAIELANDARKKVTEKALEVLSKLLSDSAAKYALEDSESNADALKQLCTQINHTGFALIELSIQKRGGAASL